MASSLLLLLVTAIWTEIIWYVLDNDSDEDDEKMSNDEMLQHATHNRSLPSCGEKKTRQYFNI